VKLIPRLLSDAVARVTEGRSGKWPSVRKAFLKAHPTCAACGGKKELNVHHILPVSWPGGKEKELDCENMVTLCEAAGRECHIRIGHLGDYKSRNPLVLRDSYEWLMKYRDRPYPRKP